jgi:hypothetical protein
MFMYHNNPASTFSDQLADQLEAKGGSLLKFHPRDHRICKSKIEAGFPLILIALIQA